MAKLTSDATPLDEDLVLDKLAHHVEKHFVKAYTARTAVTADLVNCLRLRKGKYTEDELIECGQIKTFVNVTAVKCRAAEAWINDIFASAQGKMFTLTPTSIPNAPDLAKELVVQKIKEEVTAYGMPEDIAIKYIRDRAIDLKNVTDSHMEQLAKQATDRHTKKIKDQLQDAGFDKAMKEIVSDVVTYNYAVLKGPVVRRRKRLEWDNGVDLKVFDEPIMVVERVDPFNFYPAPWATNEQEGYMCEVMRLSTDMLASCLEMTDLAYHKDNIAKVLDDNPNGYKCQERLSSTYEALKTGTTLAMDTSDDIFEVIDYWGMVRGKLLKEWGVIGVDDDYKSYAVNCWVVDNLCVRAVLNPDPMGKVPYHVTSYEKTAGTLIGGRSIPMLLQSQQEVINSAYRALRANMGLSSGPTFEINQSRLAEGVQIEEIGPRMIIYTEPDMTGSGQPAVRAINIDSKAGELLKVIDSETKRCDDVTGIPAYAYGSSQVAGAGRTLGGLAMLMGNAAKGLKQVVSNLEDIIKTTIEAFYNYNMLYDTDTTIKLDAQVVADGPTGVIVRDSQVQKTMEVLQLIGPYAESGMVKKEGIAVLLRDILDKLDMPTDKIVPDPEQAQQLQELAQQAQADQMAQGQPATPGAPVTMPSPMQNAIQPPVDGRSQPQVAPPRAGQGTVPTPQLDGRQGMAGAVMQQAGL